MNNNVSTRERIYIQERYTDDAVLSREFWFSTALFFLALVYLSHSFFQGFLFMRPCEQCVYVRFAFVVIGVGALWCSVFPQVAIWRIPGDCTILAGAVYGIAHAWNLLDAPQVLSCSLRPVTPRYPFDLPMHEVLPDYFMPTGLCGSSAPIVDSYRHFEGVQAYLINLYQASDGWYLLPSLRFGSMAECSMALFALAIVVLLVSEGIHLFHQLKA